MDLEVMPTSFHGYNYLLVMCCNHSRFIITDILKTRKASQVTESLFQKLICAHGTNIKEIYCDLDTAFKNEIVSTLFTTLGITIKFCSVQSHQNNQSEHAIESISNIIIHYITQYDKIWCIMSNIATFCKKKDFKLVICKMSAVMRSFMAVNHLLLAICNSKETI